MRDVGLFRFWFLAALFIVLFGRRGLFLRRHLLALAGLRMGRNQGHERFRRTSDIEWGCGTWILGVLFFFLLVLAKRHRRTGGGLVFQETESSTQLPLVFFHFSDSFPRLLGDFLPIETPAFPVFRVHGWFKGIGKLYGILCGWSSRSRE